MTNIAKALYSYFSQFLTAYPEYNVPSGTAFPYLTYTLGRTDWRNGGMIQVRLWYQSTSFTDIMAKINEIETDIGEGKSLPLTGGLIMLNKGNPFVQFQPSDDMTIKIAYINLDVQYLV